MPTQVTTLPLPHSSESARPAPFDRALEQACLGAALINSEAALLIANQLSAEDFYAEAHRRIHAAIVALVARGAGVDLLTVAAEIERTVGFAEAHGRDYLHVLLDTVPVATHAPQYVERLRELSRQRQLELRLRSALHVLGQDENGTAAALRREIDALQSLLAAEDRQQRRVPVLTGIELAALELSEPEAVCEGLIYKGCSSDLIAEVKRGKTTFVLDLARAVIAGGRFCEKDCAQTAVLYLSEQSPHSFAPQCARAGLLGQASFHVIFHQQALGLSWPAIGELVVEVATERGVGLVVIDNLSLWAGFAGEEENDAGVALQMLRVIERLTGAGLSVLGIRHARKGGGSINEAGRGSSAIAGGFDILLRLKSDTRPRRRLLEATGRVFAEQPPELVVELGENRRYRLVGEADGVARQDAEQTLLALLPDDREAAVPEAEILTTCSAAGIGKPTVQSVLRRLCAEGPEQKVAREYGAGCASSRAYGYWRCGDV